MTKNEFIIWFRAKCGQHWDYGMSIHRQGLIHYIKLAQSEGYKLKIKDVLTWWNDKHDK